ncbi:hypothetical protein [Hymenobacter arizonensis]|uniref:Lipoprotein n=1 Tax=Hymenobacter arizonensis TaxID=1227077 RepID=A0A1I6BRI0_HYMAR|nr:hypothetical protein [Hymenobacter arizonensis]SFQ83474.1 hypothetical protein SAMN04515668_4974 [Hymenobacter arizonensis]
MATSFLRVACWLGLAGAGSSGCRTDEQPPAPALPDVTVRAVVFGTGTDAADPSRPLPGVVVGTTSYRSCYTPGNPCTPGTRLLDQRTLVDGVATFSLGKLPPGTRLYVTSFFQRPAQRPLTPTSELVVGLSVDGQTRLNQGLSYRHVTAADAYTSADPTADLIQETTFVVP